MWRVFQRKATGKLGQSAPLTGATENASLCINCGTPRLHHPPPPSPAILMAIHQGLHFSKIATVSFFATLLVVFSPLLAQSPASPSKKWKDSPLTDKNFFPIAVWCQGPHNAARYREIGINVYVALWQGPTTEQLAALKIAKMPVICHQNEVGLTDKNNDIIIGWMHGDEPDNAQPIPGQQTYGPPIDPKITQSDYQKIVSADSTRPVLLNLGYGVAWDGWYGRGVRTRHPEDYPEYVKGCDIASFDIYPLSHEKPKDEIFGKAEVVAFGVDRLRKWAGSERKVWNRIECTRISNPDYNPDPALVRAEVWMSLIHGSQGLIYFAHQFKPTAMEAGLLADPKMTAAVAEINRQVQSLAIVLYSPTLTDVADVKSSDPDAPIDFMVKRDGDSIYVFAACMRNKPTKATITFKQGKVAEGEVMGETRMVKLTGSSFIDDFGPYGVHLYKFLTRK